MEKNEFESRQRKRQQDQENNAHEASSLEAIAQRRAYQQEKENLTKSFAQAFKLLERKEAVLEWRRKRIKLDSVRRDWFSSLIWGPLSVVGTISSAIATPLEPLSLNSDLQEKGPKVVDASEFKISDSNSSVDPDAEEDDLSFHSADQAMVLDEPVSSDELALISSSSENLSVKEESKEDSLVPPPQAEQDTSDELQFDVAADDSQTSSSGGTLLKAPEEGADSENEGGWVESEEINWLLYPGTAKTCFGVSTQISDKIGSITGAFQEIAIIHNNLEKLHSSLVSIESTFHNSIIYLWKKQVRLISTSSLSSFFSSIGQNDAVNDIRYHLNTLHSFFLLGSATFCMLIRDRLFKDNGDYGLNINGSPSDEAAGKIDRYVADIIRKVNSPIDEKFEAFVSLDLSGIKIGKLLLPFTLSISPYFIYFICN